MLDASEKHFSSLLWKHAQLPIRASTPTPRSGPRPDTGFRDLAVARGVQLALPCSVPYPHAASESRDHRHERSLSSGLNDAR